MKEERILHNLRHSHVTKIFWPRPQSDVEMKQKESEIIMRKQKQSSSWSSLFHFFILLVSLLIIAQIVGFLRVVEGGKSRVHIPDELDDVIDDEEDEAWKNWGKKSTNKFDPPHPSDLSKMEISEIQEEMMKTSVGPSFGFVKLRLGVHRSPDTVAEIAMKWTNVLKTGAIDAKFMAVDVSTIMFTMEKGMDTMELKEFVLSQPEAYEVKIGDQIHRRPGDPPLGDVIEKLRSKEHKANDPPSPTNDSEDLKMEL